jgi:hypothetical protein
MNEVGRGLAQGTRLLQELMRFKPEGLSANAWAVRAGVSRTIWADLRRHGNPSRRTMEKLLVAAGSTLAEFEALRSDGPISARKPPVISFGEPGSGGWRPAPLTYIPVIGTSPGACRAEDGGQIASTIIDTAHKVGEIYRPPSLAADPNAYAMTLVHDAMWPRFRSGRRLLVSPAAPVEIGDDVIVALAEQSDGGSFVALIGEITLRSATTVELRQFNPDVRFRIAASDVSAIQKIVGEAI